MRSIQVINVRWFNATAWYGLYLSKLLTEAGHEVLVITLDGTESHIKALAMGLPVQTIPLNANNPVTITANLVRLFRLLRFYKPDIVNCHRGESFILWGILRKLVTDFKLFRTRGDQRPPKNNVFNRILHKSVADGVIATNTAMTEHFVHRLGLPRSKVHTVLGGVDRKLFGFSSEGRTRVRMEFGYSEKDFVVGILGRFDRVKGHRELIQAVSQAYHEMGRQTIRLLLIGFATTIDTEEVKALLEEFTISSIAAITGERDDVADCISALDLGVVASLWSETIARAALEIMSCSIPLVSTKVGVMPDLLTPKRLVPPGDVSGLARILVLHMDKEELNQARQEQQERMKTLSGSDFLQTTLAIYHKS